MILRETCQRFVSLPPRTLSIVVMTALLATLCGCEKGLFTSATNDRGEEKPAADSPRRLHEYRYPAEPPVLNAEAFRTFVSRFDHRVVVIHFWASWSEASVQELMQLADWVDQADSQEIQVVACNLDDPEKWKTSVLSALEAAQANFPCVVLPRDQKATIRGWLGVDWSYDVPARCVLDVRGNVAKFAASGEPLSVVLSETRDLTLKGAYGAQRAALGEHAAALRAKLIDVRRGEAISLPEVVSDTADIDTLAKDASGHIAKEVDRRLNARIAVLGFANSKHRTAPCAFGNALAEGLMAHLRGDGYFDLVGPTATAKMLENMGTSTLAVEYDPSIVKGRLACDYLIIGCVRGEVMHDAPPAGKLAGSDLEDNPSGDPAFTPSSKHSVE